MPALLPTTAITALILATVALIQALRQQIHDTADERADGEGKGFDFHVAARNSARVEGK